tara:strand:+ start:15 stop:3554 length:3540 start_codon:yes stop_codon:yes gene_type:complete
MLLNHLSQRPIRYLNVYAPDLEQSIEIDVLNELREILITFEMNLSLNPNYNEWHRKLTNLVKNIQKHNNRVPSAIEFMSNSKAPPPYNQKNIGKESKNTDPYEIPKEFVMDMERAKQISEKIASNVKGQPEAVQHFADYVYSLAIKGYGAEKPSIVMLMGQPGTGKDTVAEAYVDALHGKKGMHSETHPEYGVDYMFRIERIAKEADIWSLLGSATGYVGSSEIPAFLRYLVLFSGGKYYISQGAIKRNHNWKPGMVMEGYYPPEMGVIFINEEHDWSKRAKNLVLKELLEKGRVKVNSPGQGGVSSMTFSGKIIAASNIGIDLVTSRNLDGSRNGPPLSYEEMSRLHEVYGPDKQKLGDAMLNANMLYAKDAGEGERGYTEEYVNRIPPESRILMRPLSPESLREILTIKMREVAEKWANNRGELGKIYLTWDEKIKDAMMRNIIAEDNARPLDDRIQSFVEKPLYDAIRENKVNIDGKDKHFFLDVKRNADRTSNLVVHEGNKRGTPAFEQFITASLSEKPAEKISKKELNELFKLEEKMKRRVFGADRAIEALADAVVLVESDKTKPNGHEKAKESSKAMFLLGPTSTGKSETMKALADALGKELVTIDFNQISGPHDMKKLFYGYHDSYGRAVPSVFMKEYDKHNGNVIFNFEEFANLTFKGLGGELMALYDILREETVTSFVDNKARSMKNVIIGMPGNVGQEWYEGIPKDIPMVEQMDARQKIYEMAMANPSVQRKTLEKAFTEAFVARIGLNRVFFYAPHTFKSLRQLSMLKLNKKLADMKARDSAPGWEIEFASEKDYLRMVEMIERHGFNVGEQGASIDKYVKDVFGTKLHMLLLKNAESDTKVVLRVPDNSNEKFEKEFVVNVEIEGEKEARDLLLPKRSEERVIRSRPEDKISTAYHEVGHHLTNKVLLGDKYKQVLVTIEPGVMQFADQFIRYLGMAEVKKVEHASYTREMAIKEMAFLLGGAKAQEIITEYNRADAGKQNDIQRATKIAVKAITEFGISPEWGNRFVAEKDINNLDDASKAKLNRLVDEMLLEADRLAEKVLVLNFKQVLAPLAVMLAKKGTLTEKDFNAFYEKHGDKIIYPEDVNYNVRMKRNKSRANTETIGHNHILRPDVPRPADHEVIDLEKKVEQRKADQVRDVKIAADAPILGFRTKLLEHGGGSCKSLF